MSGGGSRAQPLALATRDTLGSQWQPFVPLWLPFVPLWIPLATFVGLTKCTLLPVQIHPCAARFVAQESTLSLPLSSCCLSIFLCSLHAAPFVYSTPLTSITTWIQSALVLVYSVYSTLFNTHAPVGTTHFVGETSRLFSVTPRQGQAMGGTVRASHATSQVSC